MKNCVHLLLVSTALLTFVLDDHAVQCRNSSQSHLFECVH